MKHIPILALAPVILLAACGSADPEEVLETVRATEQAQSQAIAAKDLRGAVRNYADGAVLVVPGSPQATTGEAIAATYDAWLSDPNFRIEMTPGTGWASAAEDLAVTNATGTLTTTHAETGEAVAIPIASQTVWTRASGQPWRIVSEYTVQAPE